MQSAYLHRATLPGRPLIVSLHTWSGDFAQKDPLVNDILIRDYNYIHPDFRGPNRRPEACGSPLALADLEDAIAYALRATEADPAEVHLIGTSGGGHMTLLAYMRLRYPVKSFSAWAPIADLAAWYWESLGRKQKYAADILACLAPYATSPADFDAAVDEEARRRSPLGADFPATLRKGSQLYIYTGIHDGYTGSVPITHAIRVYNRVAGAIAPGDPHAQVDDSTALQLVTRRYSSPGAYFGRSGNAIGGRKIHLERSAGWVPGADAPSPYGVRLTLFEGGHEQLDAQALALLPVGNERRLRTCTIFTIGDSNGNTPGGWVDQLRAQLPYAVIDNNSQGGRTIGFDNGGRAELNALRQIDAYLAQAAVAAQAYTASGQSYDYIILCLGTNDTKAEFSADQDVVAENFDKLLRRIQASELMNRPDHPRLVVVSPPPMGVENMAEKYVGGNDRLARLVPKMQAIAQRHGALFVDVYHPLQPVFRGYADDGVHMSPAGQRRVADAIIEVLEANLPARYGRLH